MRKKKNQQPTFCRIPDGDDKSGREAVELARAYGIPLDDWQADIVRGILRETGGGWSATQVGLVVSRQSGKGQILLALELFGLVILHEQILHTAHATKTSSDAFRRLWNVLQAHDDLAALVRRHSQAVGAEYVETVDGGRIAFTTRSASAGRGLSIDRLVIDEAEDLPASEVGALAPTVFSRPLAQSIYFGTAPGVMHDSEAFRTLRRSAHDGMNPRLAWWEWCAEWGSDIDDRDLWLRVNPAVASGRVPVQAIEDDRAVLPIDQFRAERLSMWIPENFSETVFDPTVWEGLTDPDSQTVERLAIGIDAPPSRERATVCVAGRREDGQLHVEWYRTEPGLTWLPDWVSSRLRPEVRAVVIDNNSPVSQLDWRTAGVRPTTVGYREVATAAGLFVDAVSDRRIRHRGQVELTRGVLGAKRRPMLSGAAFGWDRHAPGSSALIAASLALYGVEAERPARPNLFAARRRIVVRT